MRKTILVIEDERKIAGWIQRYFETADFDVLVAWDGRTGLEMTQKRLPDMVILDLNLPGIDGVEVCRRIRQDRNPQVSGIPVIMLTARAEEEDRRKGFSTGADDYVTKPFSPKELAMRAHAIFRRMGRSGC